jgi:hypothetical protein
MKKLALCVFALWFFWITFATVGWPSFVENLYYDQNQNAIRYTKTFYDGFGGSEIHKYELNTEKDEIVTNLEDLQFEEKRLMSDLSGVQKYFKNHWFSPLQEFQLNKIPVTISLTLNYFNQLSNNESFEIIKTPPQAFTEDPENYMMSGYIFKFTWTSKISIKDKTTSEIELSTCRLDPINYRGFGLENIDTIIIIASSAKRDCMEWWYIWEEVQTLTGIEVDKQYFLPQKSILFDPNNRTLQASTGWLWIEPQMTWDNQISWNLTIEEQATIQQWLWETIKAWFTKIFSYIKRDSNIDL